MSWTFPPSNSNHITDDLHGTFKYPQPTGVRAAHVTPNNGKVGGGGPGGGGHPPLTVKCMDSSVHLQVKLTPPKMTSQHCITLRLQLEMPHTMGCPWLMPQAKGIMAWAPYRCYRSMECIPFLERKKKRNACVHACVNEVPHSVCLFVETPVPC